MEERIKSILSDLEKAKQARVCIIDNNAGIFVLPNGEQVEIAGEDILLALCHLINVPYEWE